MKSSTEQLLRTCAQVSAFFERRRQLFRMMQAEEGRMYWCGPNIRERWMAKRKNLVAAVAEVLRKGVAEGEIRPDIPVEVLANFLLGMLRTRARDLADAPEALRRDGLVIELFCRGAGQASVGARQPEGLLR